jgi:uncharacterized membrane protein YecN with MAPEG domain
MHISGIYLALALLLVLGLSARVVWLRNSRRVPLGDGGIPELAKAIRAHANAVEYLPLSLLALVLLDWEQTRPLWLHLFGSCLLLGRLLHAWGLSHHRGYSFGRATGMALTWLSMLLMAGLILWRHVLLALLTD